MYAWNYSCTFIKEKNQHKIVLIISYKLLFLKINDGGYKYLFVYIVAIEAMFCVCLVWFYFVLFLLQFWVRDNLRGGLAYMCIERTKTAINFSLFWIFIQDA